MSQRTGKLESTQELLDELRDEPVAGFTAEDLEEIRQSLPTEPTLAKITQLSLPPPWDEVFEYVSASGKQSAYWRTKQDRSRPRSEAEARRNERMREAGERMTGTRGTVERDGKVIPASAAIVAETMEDRRFPGAKVAESGRKALRRLRSVLGLSHEPD